MGKMTGPSMQGWRFDFESQRSGTTLTKFHHEIDLVNNANIFDMNMKGELDMDPMSIFYNFFCWKIGKCFTHGTRDTKIMYNKKDKNFLMGKMHLEDKSMVDGQKFQEKKLDPPKQPYELIWYQPISPSWMSSTRDMFGVDQVEVRAWHQVGKELKIETNVGEMKLTVRRTPDYFVEFIRMGETMLKSKTDVTPATLTTTVEWTEDSLKKNQATITVEATPNRKFEGIFGWDFQTLSTGNFHFDVKGENPWVGNYAIDRHANWEMNKPRYMFNWVGKSEFKTGPFSSFSPIDTKMNFVFNTRKMVLNADMVETMGGKQWGLKIHKNRFSILTGNAA